MVRNGLKNFPKGSRIGKYKTQGGGSDPHISHNNEMSNEEGGSFVFCLLYTAFVVLNKPSRNLALKDTLSQTLFLRNLLIFYNTNIEGATNPDVNIVRNNS